MDLIKYTEFLIMQLRLLCFPPNEIACRQDALYKALKECTDCHTVTRYYNLAHEIKCMMFLRNFGNIKIAMDSKHEAGCDALLNDCYQIEFVCASPGTKTSENGYDRFGFPNMKEHQIYDYSEIERFLLERIASALAAKYDFAQKHKGKTLSEAMPYLVFLGLGELAPDMLGDDCGADLLGVLMGKGAPKLEISKNGRTIDWSYVHRDTISKFNGAAIESNLFAQTAYGIVSGIIFSDAGLFEEYTRKNTWLFLNPSATVQVAKKDFDGMVYWSADSSGQYIPQYGENKLGEKYQKDASRAAERL